MDNAFLGPVKGGNFVIGPFEFVVDTGIFDGHGHHTGNGGQHFHVGLVKSAVFFVNRAEDADHAILLPEGHIHHAFRFKIRFAIHRFEEKFTFRGIRYDQGLTGLIDRTGDPFGCRESDFTHSFPGRLVIVCGYPEEKLLFLLIQ